MNRSIRSMKPSDAEAVTLLSNQLGYPVQVTNTFQWIIDILRDSSMALLVVTENEILKGWIQVFQTVRIESGYFCEIGGLVVEESSRGKGLGSLLIEAARQWTRERGHHKLKVRCNSLRVQAHQFYLKEGFVPEKQQNVFALSV